MTISSSTPRRRPLRWGRLQRVLAAVVAAVTLVMLVMLVLTGRDISSTTGEFGARSYEMTTLVNSHRELQRLEVAAHSLDTTETLDGLELRRGLLANQLRLARGGLVPGSVSIEHYERLQSLLGEFDALVTAAGATDGLGAAGPALLNVLGEAERAMKALYDAEEHRFFDATGSALDSGARSQRTLTWLALLASVSGAGLVIWLRWRARSDLGMAYASVLEEMRERRGAEDALRASEERFRALVQHATDMITVVEPSGTIRYWSPARRSIGLDDAEVDGSSYLGYVHPDDRGYLASAIATADHAGSPVEYRMSAGAGVWCTVESLITDQRDVDAIRGVVLNTRDVSERKAYETQLTHRAFHDPLTEVANRALFNSRVEHATTRLALDAAGAVAILLIDLDGFKMLNDTLGHATGDEVLAEAARRLTAVGRSTDTVARLGGDEFALLLEGTTLEAAEDVAERVLCSLAMPFEISGTEARVTASIGLAISTDPDEAGALVRHADIAMYAAKRAGKATYRRYSDAMGESLLSRLELETELRRSLDLAQFDLHYQPTVDLDTHQIVGIEALARWYHPERGLIPPDVFIPIAEETGLIVPIGDWVLERACADSVALQDTAGPFDLNVNVSPRQLRDPGFAERVLATLHRTSFPPKRLVLEITETSMMGDIDHSRGVLEHLRAAGIRIAVDDFGTGYSSLGYLRNLPIDVLKIDRTFTEGLLRGTEESAIARAIVRLGHTMQLEVIAEGIEQALQADTLRDMRCPLGQGYYFARPMPLADLAETLGTNDDQHPAALTDAI